MAPSPTLPPCPINQGEDGTQYEGEHRWRGLNLAHQSTTLIYGTLNSGSIETLNESEWPSHLLLDSRIILTLVLMDGCCPEGLLGPSRATVGPP